MAKRAGARKPPQYLLTALRSIADEVDHTANAAQIKFFEAMDLDTQEACVAAIAALLRATPFAADAWCVLAGLAPEGTPATLGLWQQAVAAGTLAIGPIAFLEMAGEFWGYLETRPYMRARAGLAQELWRHGQQDAAAAELDAMLALNPGDNQGLRYLLLGWLLTLRRDDAAAALLARYPDDGYAGWQYGAALLAFRREGGAAPAAMRALDAAMADNPHLAPLLTGAAAMPRTLPPFYQPGEASEAQLAWREMQPAWAATPDALDWLAARIAATGQARAVRPAGRKPRGKAKDA